MECLFKNERNIDPCTFLMVRWSAHNHTHTHIQTHTITHTQTRTHATIDESSELLPLYNLNLTSSI